VDLASASVGTPVVRSSKGGNGCSFLTVKSLAPTSLRLRGPTPPEILGVHQRQELIPGLNPIAVLVLHRTGRHVVFFKTGVGKPFKVGKIEVFCIMLHPA